MIRRPPRSTLSSSSAASDVYKRQRFDNITVEGDTIIKPTFTSTALTTGIINRPYSYPVTASGSPAPTFSVSGNPSWLTLNGNILSGIPPAVGTFGPVTITATN